MIVFYVILFWIALLIGVIVFCMIEISKQYRNIEDKHNNIISLIDKLQMDIENIYSDYEQKIRSI